MMDENLVHMADLTLQRLADVQNVHTSMMVSAPTGDTKVDRLLGFEGSYGQDSLGISQTAAQDILRAVGNYGEIYNRPAADLPRSSTVGLAARKNRQSPAPVSVPQLWPGRFRFQFDGMSSGPSRLPVANS